MSLEEANVIYKPFLERTMGHFVFKIEFENVLLNPSCLLDYVPKCLLVSNHFPFLPQHESPVS